MKLLILGGTKFVGRHIAAAALEAGHELTLFHRGQTGIELFPDVEHILGNRDGGLDALADRRWDAVIDTCGYVPRVVKASAERLAAFVERYVFISSISVYSDISQQGLDEASPVTTLADPTVESITGETYGGLKVLCEQVAEQALPGRVLNVRPGLIVGPYDPTDRFTYWPHRVARGGQVLAPQPPTSRVQFIDARDLARWTVMMTERQSVGTYNATSEDASWTMGTLLEQCQRITASDAQVEWVGEKFLLDQGVAPWSDLPLWLPQETTDEYRGMSSVSVTKAVAAGLTLRTLADIVRDTLKWDESQPADYEFKAGLTADREAELLRAWQDQTSSRAK